VRHSPGWDCYVTAQWCSHRKILGGAKYLNFKRAKAFCLGHSLSTRYARNLGVAWHPPGYAYISTYIALSLMLGRQCVKITFTEENSFYRGWNFNIPSTSFLLWLTVAMWQCFCIFTASTLFTCTSIVFGFFMCAEKIKLDCFSSVRFKINVSLLPGPVVTSLVSRGVVLKNEVWERRSHPTTPLI